MQFASAHCRDFVAGQPNGLSEQFASRLFQMVGRVCGTARAQGRAGGAHITATLPLLKSQPLAAWLSKQVVAFSQFQILTWVFAHASLHAEGDGMLGRGWSQAVMQRDGMPGPAEGQPSAQAARPARL